MGVLWLYVGTVFLSAFLLFLVQPMFGKLALPLLGGTPAVWNTCLFFFQGLLLAGYAYAHFSVRRFGVRRQTLWHLGVVLLPLVSLPIALPAGWSPPTEQTPVFWLMLLMAVSVGLPFFAVSTTSPLLQRWFAATSHPTAGDPYFLYAAGNVGSLLALVGYPLLIEPRLRLAEQSRLWSGAYLLLAVLIAVCAWLVRRFPAPQEAVVPSSAPSKTKSNPAAVGWKRRGYWIAMSFLPSSWLLGVTQFLTTDLSPFPLLWVIPLVLYLLTFIMVFARRSVLRHDWMVRLFAPAVVLLTATAILRGSWMVMLVHLGVFFIGSMVCHGELARSRPGVADLTDFYFCISIGGMLGGLFNALLAPLVFTGILEYPLTVCLACLLRQSLFPEQAASGRRIPELLVIAVLAVLIFVFQSKWIEELHGSAFFVDVVLAAVPILVFLYLLDRPRLFALGVGGVLVMGAYDYPDEVRILETERSFFGTHQVVADEENIHWLQHGTTVHGAQRRNSRNECLPLTYYHPAGPLGQVFGVFRGEQAKQRVALVGLGTGAAICYQQPGHEFTFYEIDPAVKRIAETPEYFSYLSECGAGDYRIILGDGRLKLAHAADGAYDMILFDAFSSDAIPMHLLTREALAMYRAKLADEGVLVFHISNRNLNLELVLGDLAADAGLVALTCHDTRINVEELRAGRAPASYVVMARQREELQGLDKLPNWHETAHRQPPQPWTDDYSDLISIIRWRRPELTE